MRWKHEEKHERYSTSVNLEKLLHDLFRLLKLFFRNNFLKWMFALYVIIKVMYSANWQKCKGKFQLHLKMFIKAKSQLAHTKRITNIVFLIYFQCSCSKNLTKLLILDKLKSVKLTELLPLFWNRATVKPYCGISLSWVTYKNTFFFNDTEWELKSTEPDK